MQLLASWRPWPRFFWASVVLAVAWSANLWYLVGGEPQVPCFFIFGDSLVDSGNNNHLNTLAKVNYPPYGIDFPGGRPTGRFCNGRTTADIIGQLLGFDAFIPPFASANDSEILKGVNYASGSAGILKETGTQMGTNIALIQQLRNHQVAISRIIGILRSKKAATNHLKQCLYFINIGSNDYLNNYFLPEHFNSSKQYTPEQYADVLVKHYSRQITSLYISGARKMAVNEIGAIGCTPHSVTKYDTKGSVCVDHMNDAVTLFNKKLKLMVDQHKAIVPDGKFLYMNSNSSMQVSPQIDFKVAGCCIFSKRSTSKWLDVAFFRSYEQIDFKVAGCCKVNEVGQCVPHETPCIEKTLFWDSFHPTEATNLLTAPGLYNQLKTIL